MAKKKSFRFVYFCILGALALFCAIFLIYVGSTLANYENSQAERIIEAQIDKLSAAAETQDDSLFGLISAKELSEEAKTSLRSTLATGTLTYELHRSAAGGSELVYSILADGERAVDVTLSGKTGATKLFIFPMTDWSLISVTPAMYDLSFSLPASASVTLDGAPVEGTEVGGMVKYEISSPSRPEIIITDAIGNTVSYDGETKLAFTEYLIRIPSNYTLKSKNGTSAPLSLATLEDIDDYKYVAQYTTMPRRATYNVTLLGEEPDFVIVDNLGNEAEYTVTDHTVVIDGQASSATIPEGFLTTDRVLGDARTWSLFMTADLQGAAYGYYTVEDMLLPDSYLCDVAYKWATGIDITFTSVHYLDNPPFFNESVTGFVKYSPICFSCDVTLSKVMHLNSGADVTDSMNSRFYYVLKDGEWYVADIQEIIED